MENDYSRIDLACEQLETAIELFLSGRSIVSALTLSGAAEEILGKAIEIRSERNALKYEAEVIKQVHDLLHKKQFSWKDFLNGKNLARNAAKHMDSPNELVISVDLEEEAYKMIVRACENHRRLGLSSTENMQRFEEWFYAYIVGA